MHYVALACDYDGTIATDGRVPSQVVEALRKVSGSGRKLVLVTGRRLDDLRDVFRDLDVFDRVLADNGGVLLDPSTGERQRLAEEPSEALISALRERGVEPLEVGDVVVATREPHDGEALATIRELGLEREIIYNKGAVMVLPSGVNKATGLDVALEELGLSPLNVVGVGDAENDHAFLERCALRVAVANAVPALKDRADVVTDGARGDGVVELIDQLLQDDLDALDRRMRRHLIEIGSVGDEPATIDPYRSTVLVVGASGSGKSTLATGILERLVDREFQCCLIDPEGDYDELEFAVTIGGPSHVPPDDEVLELLSGTRTNVVVNLLGVRLDERPDHFGHLLGHVDAIRSSTGRPHWLVVDEAHHLLPPETHGRPTALPRDTGGVLMITVHPELMAPSVLAEVDVVVSTSAEAEAALAAFARITGVEAPTVPAGDGHPVLWRAGETRAKRFVAREPTTARRRHMRKYVEGDLGDHSFVFVGPEGKLALRASNLVTFEQMARGVDEETWRFHLSNGDIERWLRDAIKDEDLAVIARDAAELDDRDESREAVLSAIGERYTLPA